MLKEISKLAQEFTGLEDVKKELKKLQSVKCRLKKQKAKATYEQEMAAVVAKEQALKEVREYFEPKKVTVTSMTWEQICELNYDETIKAIKSIQSKKCNTQYLTENIEENVEYQDALRIEEMLKKHKENVKPIEDTVVRKSDIDNLIDHVSNLEEKIDKAYMLELLENLKEGRE